MGSKVPVVYQSMSGLVRENLTEINTRISNGVRVAYIHSEYVSKGMVGNLWSFRKALTRARKRVRMAAKTVDAMPVRTPQVSAKVTKEVVHQTPDEQGIEPNQDQNAGLDKYFKRKPIFKTKD